MGFTTPDPFPQISSLSLSLHWLIFLGGGILMRQYSHFRIIFSWGQLSLSLVSLPPSLCPLICESRSRRSDILADSEDFSAGLLMVFPAKTTQCHARSIPHLLSSPEKCQNGSGTGGLESTIVQPFKENQFLLISFKGIKI